MPDYCKQATSSSLCDAFFRGKIRDRTTKDSRKAAECLATLKTIKKNPAWKPVDNRTKILKKAGASMSPAELAKMRMQIGDTVPEEVVAGIARELADCSSSSSSCGHQQMQQAGFKNPMLCDVEAEVHRRIHALGKSGKMFEEHAGYVQDQQLAADAEYLVRGIDPQAARSTEAYVRSRKIQVLRKHWMASKQGFYLTQYGMAYIHTDGSVAIFPQGNENHCRCGAVHVT